MLLFFCFEERDSKCAFTVQHAQAGWEYPSDAENEQKLQQITSAANEWRQGSNRRVASVYVLCDDGENPSQSSSSTASPYLQPEEKKMQYTTLRRV